MQSTERDAELTARYAEKLESGKAFYLAAASARSIMGYQPPTRSDQYAKAVQILGKLARVDDRMATLVQSILREMPLHQTAGDTVAKVYEAGARALGNSFFDTINAASPEPGRYSDNVQDFTIRDRVLLMVALNHVAAVFCPTGCVVGWCLAALAKEHVHFMPDFTKGI